MGGWDGDVDDNVTQTHPTVPPQEPFYSVITVLSSCRTFLHNLNPYFWSMRINLRCFELFAEKLEIGWGKAFLGDVPSRVFTLAKKVRHDESTVNTE